MTSPPHEEVAAYALGILDEADCEAFERHLADCLACQVELQELYALPEALDLLKGPPVPRPARRRREAALASLLDRVAAFRRRRARARWLAVAAAVLIAAAAPVLVPQLWRTERPPAEVLTAQPPPAPAETLTAQSPDARVRATVALSPKAWGTAIDLELSGVTGPLTCRLVVVSRSGESDVVGSWQVPAGRGYGVAGRPQPLRFQGGTALARAVIERFEVRTDDGTALLRVPAA